MSFAYETWELMRKWIEAANDKRLSNAMQYDRSTLHRMARHPADAENPDGTGSPNILDRFVGGCEILLACGTAGRVMLKLLRLFFDTLFARLLDNEQPVPLDPSELPVKAGRVLRETADVLDELAKGKGADVQRLTQELIEAQEVLASLTRGIQAGIGAPTNDVRPLRTVG